MLANLTEVANQARMNKVKITLCLEAEIYQPGPLLERDPEGS